MTCTPQFQPAGWKVIFEVLRENLICTCTPQTAPEAGGQELA